MRQRVAFLQIKQPRAGGGVAVTPSHRPAAALKHDAGNHQVGACASS